MIDFIKTAEEIVSDTSINSQSIYDAYDKVSISMNIRGIKNKIFNIKDLFGIGEHYFMLMQVFGEFYYLIDLALEDKCISISNDKFNKYLEYFGIVGNNLTISDIYFKSISR